MSFTTIGKTKPADARRPERRRQLLPVALIAARSITGLTALATPVAHADIRKFNDCIKDATIQGSRGSP